MSIAITHRRRRRRMTMFDDDATAAVDWVCSSSTLRCLVLLLLLFFVLVHEMASCSLASCHRRKRHSKKQKHCARSYIYRRANNSFALELQARAKWRTTTTTKSKRRQTSEQVLCFCLFHTGGTAERAISAYTNCCREASHGTRAHASCHDNRILSVTTNIYVEYGCSCIGDQAIEQAIELVSVYTVTVARPRPQSAWTNTNGGARSKCVVSPLVDLFSSPNSWTMQYAHDDENPSDQPHQNRPFAWRMDGARWMPHQRQSNAPHSNS